MSAPVSGLGPAVVWPFQVQQGTFSGPWPSSVLGCLAWPAEGRCHQRGSAEETWLLHVPDTGLAHRGQGLSVPRAPSPHQPQPQVQKLHLAPSCAPPAPPPCRAAANQPSRARPRATWSSHVPTVVSLLKWLETTVGLPALCPPAFLFCKVRTWNTSSPPSTVAVISCRKGQARPPEGGGLRP